jgi:hypothetical protein
MNKLRKVFTVSVMMMTILSMSAVVVPSAKAAGAGDLVKVNGASAVYYIGNDSRLYVFPNEDVYKSWYSDFSSVITISATELNAFGAPKANITMRPGTKLVKRPVPTAPEVYAVEPGGVLRWIDSEATAKTLYGDNWAKRVVDVADSFFTNYSADDAKTNKVTATAYPAGSLVKFSGSADVYYVDTDGMARKVDSEAAFVANRFNWNDVVTATIAKPTDGSAINGKDTGLTDTASGAAKGGITPGAGTGLTVALASDTPAASTIPSKASGAVFAKYNFTASADGAVTLSSVTLKRTGVGATDEFQNLYLYEGSTRLTNGRSVNSSTNMVTFSNLNYQVPAGTTKTLSVAADIKSGKSGSHAFEISSGSDITTSAAVSGSFPIKGNIMTLNATPVGVVTVTHGSNPSNVTAGAQEIEIGSFNLEVSSTEDATVKSVTMYQGGTVSNGNITNLKLKQGDTTVATASVIPANSRLVLNFDTPFEITKGNSKKFVLYADVSTGARADETIKFYMEANADVTAVGKTYGYPLAVAIGSADSAGDTASGTFDGTSSSTYFTTTSMEAGDIALVTNGPVAGNVAVNSNDVVLLNFNITAQSNTEIRSLRLELHNETIGGTTADLDASNTTFSANHISDIKITDIDTGVATWGAIDGSSLLDVSDEGSENDGVYYNFTNTVTLDAGETHHYRVTVDMDSSAVAGGDLIAVIGKVGVNGATSYTFAENSVKSTETNTYLTSLVPSTYSRGNNMTIQDSALSVSRASVVPVAQSVVRGSTNVEAASIVFDASTSGSDVKVTSLKLSGYVDGYSGTAALTKDQTGTSPVLAIKDLVSNIRIYERANDGTLTQLTSKTGTFNTSGEETFSSLNWVIPKESTKVLVVKVDVANNTTILDAGAADVARFAVDIHDVSEDISAETVDKGSTVSVTATDKPNDAEGTSGAQVTVRESGTIAMSNGTDPVSGLVVAGTSGVTFDQVKFSSAYEDMKITKLRVTAAQTTGNLSQAVLSYPDMNGTIKTAVKAFVGANADFTGLDIYVRKDVFTYVDVKADIKTITNGATPGSNTTLVVSGTTGFEATGASGGSTNLTQASSGSDTTGNAMYVVKSKPTFTTQSLGSTTLSGGVSQAIYKFSITADNGNDVAIKQLPFSVTVSDANGSDLYLHSIRLRRVATNGSSESSDLYATLRNITGDGYATSASNGILNKTYSTLGYPIGDNTNSRTVAAIFDTNNSYDGSITGGGDSLGEEIISAGTTRTYELIATPVSVNTGDAVSVKMPRDGNTTFAQGTMLFSWTDPDDIIDLGTAGGAGSTVSDYVWSDNSSGTSHTAVVSGSSADWYNGAFFFETDAVSRTK